MCLIILTTRENLLRYRYYFNGTQDLIIVGAMKTYIILLIHKESISFQWCCYISIFTPTRILRNPNIDTDTNQTAAKNIMDFVLFLWEMFSKIFRS